jgi:hypothetical protein
MNDELEDFARRQPILFPALLFVFALSLRLALLSISGLVIGTAARNLSFFYDGLAYLYISKTFPLAYVTPVPHFPLLLKPMVFTVWFPVYPFIIRLADFLFRDTRVSALATAQLCASASTVLFYQLAKTTTRRPALASILFCFFPPVWLLAGSLALVEPVYVVFFITSFLYFRTGQIKKSAACAAAAILTQKSGFLILPIILIDELCTNGPRRMRRLAPFILSPLPTFLVQAGLCAHLGDPLGTLKIMQAAKGDAGFQLPFQGFLRGFTSSEQWFRGHFWLRKAAMAFCASFYLGILAAAWRRRSRLDRGLIAWLGVVLLFNSFLGGDAGYVGFPRYMIVAAPAALLLLIELLPSGLASRPGHVLAMVLLWIPLVMTIDVTEIIAAVDLILRIWPKGYFQALLRFFS